MRVLHFSDPHLHVRAREIAPRQWLGKRLVGGLNFLLLRRGDFAGASEKLAELAAFAEREEVALVICTGDYTTLGTRVELEAARRAVAPLMERPAGFVHVPGNHDLYVRSDVRASTFERVFGEPGPGDLPEHAVDGGWPFARLVGEGIAVVAVNSARPNPAPWRSSGRIPRRQIEALAGLLADPRLAGRFVFLLTHYGPRRGDGRLDHWFHGLENAEDLLDACRGLARGAILHGHLHRRFRLDLPGAPPIFCAGSATRAGRESFWLFEIEAERARARGGRWDGRRFVLESGAVEEIAPPRPPGSAEVEALGEDQAEHL